MILKKCTFMEKPLKNLIDYFYFRLMKVTERAWVYDKVLFPCFIISLLVFCNFFSIGFCFARSSLSEIVRTIIIASLPVSFVLLLLNYGINKKMHGLEDIFMKLNDEKKSQQK